MNSQSGIEWVVACLTPWALSPHPNFGSSAPPKPEVQLALVAEGRGQEIFGYLNRSADQPLEDPLVAAAWESTQLTGQASALDRLLRLALDDTQSLGARIASALFGLLAASELDQLSRVLPLVIEGLGLESPVDPQTLDPSSRLCWSAMLLQCAFRAEESHTVVLAERFLDHADELLPNGAGLRFDRFATSRGIAWGAAQVQRDLAATIRRRLQRMRARLEFPNGRTWERAIRARAGWIDYRLADLGRYVFERKAEQAFARNVNGIRSAQTVRFGMEAQREYELVLLSELGGDRDQSQRARAAQAWRILEGDALLSADAASVQMALRLLRQAANERQLTDAIERVRISGPLAGLLGDARAVLSRISAGGFTATEDLLVLGGAADLLAESEIDEALRAVLDFVPKQQQVERLSWSALNDTWKTVARFAPVADRDEYIASAAVAQLSEPQVLSNTIVVQSILSAVRSIDWSKVEEGTRQRWDAWAAAPLSEELWPLQPEVAQAQGLDARTPPAPTTLAAAAWLINHWHAPATPDPELLAAAEKAILMELQKEVENAIEGVTAFGGYDAGEIATVFAQHFKSAPVWAALAVYLAEPRLASQLKTAALERLAAEPEDTPVAVKEALAATADGLLSKPGDDPFLHPGLDRGNPSGLRALAALGVLDASRTRPAIYDLLSQGELGRLEAARSLLYCSKAAGQEWTQTLLLGLATDASPRVAGQASHALSQLVVDDRYGELEHVLKSKLLGPGVLVPLGVLRGFQRLAERDVAPPAWVSEAIEAVLANATESNVVRKTARDAQAAIHAAKQER